MIAVGNCARAADRVTGHRFGARCALRADLHVHAGQVLRVVGKRGLDAAVLTVPADDAVSKTLKFIRGGGQLLLFAHNRSELDFSAVCVDEKDMLGSYYSADFHVAARSSEDRVLRQTGCAAVDHS